MNSLFWWLKCVTNFLFYLLLLKNYITQSPTLKEINITQVHAMKAYSTTLGSNLQQSLSMLTFSIVLSEILKIKFNIPYMMFQMCKIYSHQSAVWQNPTCCWTINTDIIWFTYPFFEAAPLYYVLTPAHHTMVFSLIIYLPCWISFAYLKCLLFIGPSLTSGSKESLSNWGLNKAKNG